jgi:hypothetical protein
MAQFPHKELGLVNTREPENFRRTPGDELIKMVKIKNKQVLMRDGKA